MKYSVAIGVLLALAGCASTRPAPAPVVVPELVRVPVTRYILPPDELMRPCPIPQLADRTVESVVETNNARLVALEKCNQQLQRLRELVQE